MTLEDTETVRREGEYSLLPEDHPSRETPSAKPPRPIAGLSAAEKSDNYQGVLFQLSEEWRVAICRDGIQYLLQYKYPTEWRTCSYPTSREGLRRSILRIVNDEAIYLRAKAWINSLPDYISKKEVR